MRNVFQSEILADAAQVRNLLRDNGIDAQLLEGQSPYPTISCSEVWILRLEDRDRAIALVRSIYADRSKHSSSWSCDACDELNPASFPSCWKCSALHH